MFAKRKNKSGTSDDQSTSSSGRFSPAFDRSKFTLADIKRSKNVYAMFERLEEERITEIASRLFANDSEDEDAEAKKPAAPTRRSKGTKKKTKKKKNTSPPLGKKDKSPPQPPSVPSVESKHSLTISAVSDSKIDWHSDQSDSGSAGSGSRISRRKRKRPSPMAMVEPDDKEFDQLLYVDPTDFDENQCPHCTKILGSKHGLKKHIDNMVCRKHLRKRGSPLSTTEEVNQINIQSDQKTGQERAIGGRSSHSSYSDKSSSPLPGKTPTKPKQNISSNYASMPSKSKESVAVAEVPAKSKGTNATGYACAYADNADNGQTNNSNAQGRSDALKPKYGYSSDYASMPQTNTFGHPGPQSSFQPKPENVSQPMNYTDVMGYAYSQNSHTSNGYGYGYGYHPGQFNYQKREHVPNLADTHAAHMQAYGYNMNPVTARSGLNHNNHNSQDQNMSKSMKVSAKAYKLGK